MDIFKKAVVEAIAGQVELEKDKIEALLEIPPNPEMGDYAFPCFQLSKVLRKAPNVIAEELKGKLSKPEEIEKIENAGGYLNFYVDKSSFIKSTLSAALEKGTTFGSSNIGNSKNIVVDYASLNIAKPVHIGHLPTIAIGDSLYRIHKFLGYNCIRINHLGDWGTQFGKLIVAYKKWGSRELVEKDPIKELVKLYVQFHDEAEKDESLNDEGRAAFKAIEDGKEEYVELWKWFSEVSIKDSKRLYALLNVDFDSWNGESFYMDKMDKPLNELEDKGLLVESQGAKIVDLEPYGMPPFMARRSDGATLYATRDLAAIFFRKEEYDFDKVLYVVATQQNLHFKQLFKVIDLMGYEWAKNLIHVSFGMVGLESGAIATRKGRVIYLEDVLNESVNKVKKIIEDRNPSLENKDEIAKQVGIGAVKFSVLSNNKIKDITFSWDKVLSFEGETAPYVQYMYARICSIFRKVGSEEIGEVDYSLLNTSDAVDVITQISRFPKIVNDAAEKYEPSIISRHIIDLAQSFSKFYHNNPVINDDNKLQNARLSLCKATRSVIETGMGLLGIECPDRM